MKNYITKALLLSFCLAVFSMAPSYALTFSEVQKLLASDGEDIDFFSHSVSISGDTAVIGALFDDDNGPGSGSAYVFVRDGAGVWREQQKLLASDGKTGNEFGCSVSISGDTALIGALFDDGNGDDSSSAYVFVRDSIGVWHEQQKLTADDGTHFSEFGCSVSISGNTAVIGAVLDDANGRDSGSATVFERDGTGLWREQQKLIASDGSAGDRFGFSVSLYGDTAVIGAWLDDDNGGNSGSAYIFVRDASGVWHEQQKLIASDGAGSDYFGFSVSIFEDTLMIGARNDDDNVRDSGSVYVFKRGGTGVWSEQQKLLASDGGTKSYVFGDAVSISRDMAIIAAGSNENGVASGSAYVFARDDTGVWREQQRLTASDAAAGDIFGISVSISGDTVVIGSERDNDNGLASGSAYVFEASDPNNDLITIEKLINHRVRETPADAAPLLAGTRYRVEYKVTNNSTNRLYPVQVFEGGQLVCDLYALDPGESKQRYKCASNQDVLLGSNSVPATVTGNVSGSSQVLTNQTNAYYTGLSNMPGKLKVTHYVNDRNADTQAAAVDVNGNEAEVLFRVENTGSIELYRVKTFHDPASPVNSGWQQQCFIGTLDPGQVRYCKRTVSVTQEGLNKTFGRAQGSNANVSATGFVNASNPTYFNVVLP